MACIVGGLRPFVNEQNVSRNTTAMARPNNIMALNAQGLTRQKIADQLGIGVASVYRILKIQAMSEKKRKTPLKKNVVKPKRVERKPKPVPDTGQLKRREALGVEPS